MIALDSSALIEVVAAQSKADVCAAVLLRTELIISGATLAEALIVARRKQAEKELDQLIDLLRLEVEEVVGVEVGHDNDFGFLGAGAAHVQPFV